MLKLFYAHLVSLSIPLSLTYIEKACYKAHIDAMIEELKNVFFALAC